MKLVRLFLVSAIVVLGIVSASASELVRELAAGHPRKIVVFGTSLTAGGAWVGLMKDWLAATYPGTATIVNKGISGRNSANGVSVVSGVVAEKPDTVFIEFCMNDAFLYEPGKGTRLTVPEAKANLEKIIDAIKKENPKVEIILQTMNTVWDSPKGHNASAGLRPNLADYYQMYRDVAKAKGYLLIDNEKSWKELQEKDKAKYESYVVDGTHPSATGAKEIIFPLLQKELTADVKK